MEADKIVVKGKHKKSKHANNNRKHGQGNPKIGKVVRMDKMQTFLTCVMGHLNMFFGTGSHEELIGRYRNLSTSDPTKYQLTRSFIHNTSRDFFGTWIPTMKFHTTPTNGGIVGVTGVLTSVVALRAAYLAYFNSFAGVFDEYRFKGPVSVHYRPTYVSATGSGNQVYGVGALDFVDGTVMASIAGALMYDTAKIFPLTLPPTGGLLTTWESHLLGNPDNLWLDTSVQTTDVVWFKTYNYTGVTGSVSYGVAEWVAEIEFRQLYGI